MTKKQQAQNARINAENKAYADAGDCLVKAGIAAGEQAINGEWVDESVVVLIRARAALASAADIYDRIDHDRESK